MYHVYLLGDDIYVEARSRLPWLPIRIMFFSGWYFMTHEDYLDWRADKKQSRICYWVLTSLYSCDDESHIVR